MHWTKSIEHDVALYFEAHYVLWAVGKLEPEVADELDALNPGGENWKLVMERECPWTRESLQKRFRSLCETMSDEEALDNLLEKVGFQKC